MTLLVGLMIAAGGPHRIAARISWPLHVALSELHREAGRRGRLAQLPFEFDFEPAPDVGLRARGADEALSELCREGLLRRVGELRAATLEVDPDVLAHYRRSLMSLEPATVRLLQRAGSRWAALSSTLVKNAAMPARSSASTVVSPHGLSPRAGAHPAVVGL